MSVAQDDVERLKREVSDLRGAIIQVVGMADARRESMIDMWSIRSVANDTTKPFDWESVAQKSRTMRADVGHVLDASTDSSVLDIGIPGPRRVQAIRDAITEMRSAVANHNPYNSAHEAYGVLAEEFDEFEKHVFTNEAKRDLVGMRREAIQIAAVAMRIAAEVCDEERGRR